MPEPILPLSIEAANQDEIAFYERVKKYLENRTSINEFLKLYNLFSQQVIYRDTLYYQGCNYLTANQELLFAHYLAYLIPTFKLFNKRRVNARHGIFDLSSLAYSHSYTLQPV